MGLIEKLKNVFFEEELIEEEVKEEKKEKTPIAKKIELPENKKPAQEEIEIAKEFADSETDEFTEEKKKRENLFRFPMDFEEEDFKAEPTIELQKEEIQTVREVPIYGRASEEASRPYEVREVRKVETRTTFKASPIISPIYGILDKNYKKEEIVAKKEIKLSSYAKKPDLDTVRQKAYGDLASDITASIMEVEEEKNPVYDLNEENSPEVAKVTVGDAEEYFEDLGLEYNVDYKDSSTNNTKASRRTEKKSVVENYEDDIDSEELQDSDKEIEDNLFDLIDSMYEDKE